MPTNERSSLRLAGFLKIAGIAGLCVISGAVGSGLTRHFGSSSYTLSYADFISIMLTAISLLMTVLAIFLAVIGFMGWTTIEQKVHGKTEDFLAKGFEKGGRLEKIVLDVIETNSMQVMFRGIQPVSEDSFNENEEDNDEDSGAA